MPLCGEGLGLDSIDILEIALVVSKRHGGQLKVENAENRQVFISLRALLDAQLPLPEIALVVCATAPWSSELAQEGETRCNTRLMEIYGSTETGQIASRRPTQSTQWRLFPGIRWLVEGDRVRATGGHIETAIAMNDVIEPVSDDYFLLHGRIADLVNIAGKRHSLVSLNHLLNRIPGVMDGAFYMPDEPIDAGDGRITLRTRAARQTTIRKQRYRLALELHIEDNGPGVPEAIRDRIFHPLVSGREGGSGLGLPIARDIARAHGGDLTLSDSPLGGLRASVKIPV